MSQTKNPKTDFISFLQKEYPLKREDIDYSKKDVLYTTKLRKVLDVFVDGEKNKENKLIDNKMIATWQKATEEEKAKVLNSFLQKQRFLKKDIDKTLEMLNKKIDLEKETVFIKDWKIALTTVCFLAFFFSALVVRFFPNMADSIVYLTQKATFTKESYVLKDDNSNFEKVNKKQLGEFIRNNSKYIVSPQDSKPYSLSVSADEIKGRVAGVSEKGDIVPEIKIKTPEIDELEKINSKKNLLDSFLEKQVELANKIKDLIK